MNMTAQTAKEVVDGMIRDGMPKKTQKKFLQFAIKTRGHLFPKDAIKIYEDRIAQL